MGNFCTLNLKMGFLKIKILLKFIFRFIHFLVIDLFRASVQSVTLQLKKNQNKLR